MSDRDTEIIANISRTTVPDVPPPTPEELVTWANGKEWHDVALAKVAGLAVGLMAARPPDVRPTPTRHISAPLYMYMGLALDADSSVILTLHFYFYFEIADERLEVPSELLPSAFLVDVTDTWNGLDPETRREHPLVPLVRAWHNRPLEVDPERRVRAIIPERLAHATPQANRTASKYPDGMLFTPAHYARAPRSHPAQLSLLPGFGMENPPPAPTLPVALLKLGEVGDGHGRGAPMAPRLALDAVMSAPLNNRKAGQPVAMTFTLGEVLEWLYPEKRPSPRKYWERLIAARRLLNSDDALIPLIDPKTGKATLRQVIMISEFPAQPDLTGSVRIVVDLPAGHGDGPQINRLALRRLGLVSAPAWRLYLGLAYLWHNPGVTTHPGRKGMPWLQSDDPNLYPETPPELLVRLAYPDVEKPERYHGQRMRKALGAILEGGIAREISGKIVAVRHRE